MPTNVFNLAFYELGVNRPERPGIKPHFKDSKQALEFYFQSHGKVSGLGARDIKVMLTALANRASGSVFSPKDDLRNLRAEIGGYFLRLPFSDQAMLALMAAYPSDKALKTLRRLFSFFRRWRANITLRQYYNRRLNEIGCKMLERGALREDRPLIEEARSAHGLSCIFYADRLCSGEIVVTAEYCRKRNDRFPILAASAPSCRRAQLALQRVIAAWREKHL
jgi:hypothetical protein